MEENLENGIAGEVTPAAPPESKPPQCDSTNEDALVCGLGAGHEHAHRNVTGKGVKYWQNEAEISSFFTEDPETAAPLPGSAGKRRMELIDLSFIAEMALQMEGGIKDGRVAHDWKDLPADAAIQERTGAILRHLLAAQTRGAVDPDSGASHWAAIADCAMICWGLERQAAEESEG